MMLDDTIAHDNNPEATPRNPQRTRVLARVRTELITKLLHECRSTPILPPDSGTDKRCVEEIVVSTNSKRDSPAPARSAIWTRLPDELALRFNADAVVHGTSNPLLAAEVALGRLH